MLIVALAAITLALVVRLGADVFSYITGPVAGAALVVLAYRRERTALIKGDALRGLLQGIIAIYVHRRGYVFPNIAIIRGALYLAALAVHLAAGLGFGALLFLALRWAHAQADPGDTG
jgi:hypothetical protein